jgi:hypothetical protein
LYLKVTTVASAKITRLLENSDTVGVAAQVGEDMLGAGDNA